MTNKLELKSSHEVIDTVNVADVESIFYCKPTDPDILTVLMKDGKRLYCDEVCPLQDEPKECMYSKDNYTDEDRKVLCDGCEEECRFNKKEDSASEELEKVVEEIVDPTVLNAYGVKEIANRLRRTMMDSASEIDFEAEVKKLWEEINTGHSYSIVDSYNIFYGLCMDIADWQKEQQNIIEPTGDEQVKESLISKHEDKTCKENGNSLTQEPVSEDLEKVSKEWLASQLDKSYANYGEGKMMELTHFDGYAMLDAIEFGANWQKQQILDSNTTLQRTFELGKQEMKQQMMAKAIDATVHIDAGGYPYIPQMELYNYDKDIHLAKEGDKYKVILIKE